MLMNRRRSKLDSVKTLIYFRVRTGVAKLSQALGPDAQLANEKDLNHKIA
jgi:hypothetical protein